MYVLWLILVVWQKPTHCKAVILQLKIKKNRFHSFYLLKLKFT